MTTVRDAINKLHAERGDFRDLPVTVPGKGHWLWGLYMPIYPHGFNECGKKHINPHNTAVNEA